MTQEELKLVLEALKWCHGGEPCGTSEAIAVVEKALANVATNDTSKEYVDEMQKQRHETVEDNSQQWKGMDGAIAFHLIERHADGWNDIRKMMGEWLSANTPQRTEQEPVAWGVDWGKAGDIPCVSIIKRLPDGGIKVLAVEYAPYSYTTSPKQEPVAWKLPDKNVVFWEDTKEVDEYHGFEPTIPLYPHPQRSESSGKPAAWVGLTDEERKNIMIECESTGDWAWELKAAQDIEAKLKQKNGYAEEKNT